MLFTLRLATDDDDDDDDEEEDDDDDDDDDDDGDDDDHNEWIAFLLYCSKTLFCLGFLNTKIKFCKLILAHMMISIHVIISNKI